MTSTHDRTTAAEARAIEEGHHAILGRDALGAYVDVKSETLGHRGIAYRVRVATTGPDTPLVFTCDPTGDVGPDGHHHRSSMNGVATCKHMALAARRLGREGFARIVGPGRVGDVVLTDARWLATAASMTTAVRTAAHRTAAEGLGGDPFAGF